MKKAKFFVGFAAALLLAACGAQSTNQTTTTEVADVKKSNFPISVTNEGTPIQGGVLKYAIVSDSPISGIFSSVFYENAYDAEVIAFIDESLFQNDENYKVKEGIGKLDYSLENKTVTVTIKKDVKWSDGQPLTIDDYIYAFEVIAHKDYKGIRYTKNIQNIEGVEEYHKGEADKISGITKVDDYTVTFKVKEITPAILQAGGFWSAPHPKHIYKDIPVAEQAASEASRTKPVGLGAFRLTGVVSGESVTLEANPYYWQGQPKLSGVVMDVVSSTNAADEFAAGNYDLMSVPNQTAIYDSFKELKNATLIGKWQNAISYLGFKLGTYDKETGKNVANPNAKMANQSLRQAMGYALNLDEIASAFYGQLRVRANSLLTPVFGLHDNSLEGYKFDLEKAKKLLDDAGYKDVDKDGYREDPKGQKLTINFATMSGGDSQTQAQTYIQYWKEAGLRVELINGRTIEFNTFYDMVEADDPSIDIYMAAWTVGGNPHPGNLWGDNPSNYTRFVSPEHNALLAKLESSDMFDEAKQKEAYKEWQKFAVEQAFAIPINYRTTLTAVNKRVKQLNGETGQNNYGYHLHKLELLSDTPVK